MVFQCRAAAVRRDVVIAYVISEDRVATRRPMREAQSAPPERYVDAQGAGQLEPCPLCFGDFANDYSSWNWAH
jgi:hypothetical protein